MFEAFKLDGLPLRERHRLSDGPIEIVYPELTPDDVALVSRQVRSAGERARGISVSDRIQAIELALETLTDRHGAPYEKAVQLLQQTARYSPEMVRAILDHIRTNWTRPALERLVRSELGDPARLDQFVLDPVTGRHTMAFGPDLAAHIFSGNVPGVAVESLIRALLVKSASFGKLAAEEPVLPVLFTRALPDAMRDTIALTYWPGGTEPLDGALFQHADAVIVYGDEETAASVRSRVPAGRRIIVHGPRISVGVVGGAALLPAAFDQTTCEVAEAVAWFDQQGCVSPHVVYVVGDFAAAQRLGYALARQLEAVENRLPRGRINTSEAIATNEARARAEFGGIAGRKTELLIGKSHTVVIDADDTFQPSCLNRFVYVKPLSNPGRLSTLLQPVRAYLQSVAMCGLEERQAAELALELGRLGVTRITSFIDLPWPPLEWHHDGSRPLGELLRWVDWDG